MEGPVACKICVCVCEAAVLVPSRDNYRLRILPSTCKDKKALDGGGGGRPVIKTSAVLRRKRKGGPRAPPPHPPARSLQPGLKAEYVITWIIVLRMSLKSYSRIYWSGIKLSWLLFWKTFAFGVRRNPRPTLQPHHRRNAEKDGRLEAERN